MSEQKTESLPAADSAWNPCARDSGEICGECGREDAVQWRGLTLCDQCIVMRQCAAIPHEFRKSDHETCIGCGYLKDVHYMLEGFVEAERERCARVAERQSCVYSGPALRIEGFDLAKIIIAAKIRSGE